MDRRRGRLLYVSNEDIASTIESRICVDQHWTEVENITKERYAKIDKLQHTYEGCSENKLDLYLIGSVD